MLYIVPCRINEHLPPYVFAGCTYTIPLVVLDSKRRVLCSSEQPRPPDGLPIDEALSRCKVVIKEVKGGHDEAKGSDGESVPAITWGFVDPNCKIKGFNLQFSNRSLSRPHTISIQGSAQDCGSSRGEGQVINLRGSYYDTTADSGHLNSRYVNDNEPKDELPQSSSGRSLRSQRSPRSPGRPPKSESLNKISVNLNVLLPVKVTPVKYMLRVTERNADGSILLADDCSDEKSCQDRNALGLLYNNISWYKDEKGRDTNFIDCNFELVDREDRVQGQADDLDGLELDLNISLYYCKEVSVTHLMTEGLSEESSATKGTDDGCHREYYLTSGEFVSSFVASITT